jgi:hypothetical protein
MRGVNHWGRVWLLGFATFNSAFNLIIHVSDL